MQTMKPQKPIRVEAGKHYIVIPCHYCEAGIALLEAPDDPAEEVAVPSSIELYCRHCEQTDVYIPPEEAVRSPARSMH